MGYRIGIGGRSAFYVPDVAAICDEQAALRDIDVYLGDGASATRPILRRREGGLIGHAPICSQLDWCRAQRVTRALFTHCGSLIVGGDERLLGALVRRLGRERGIEVRIAHDGMELNLDQSKADGALIRAPGQWAHMSKTGAMCEIERSLIRINAPTRAPR